MLKPKDTLYYDGRCPLCLREIRSLEKRAGQRLQLVDVHSYTPSVEEPSVDSMLKILHLKTFDGKWLTGVDATVRAWSHTRWQRLFDILRWPLIRTLADRAYDYWAERRYDRLNYPCNDACPGYTSRPHEAHTPDSR